MSPDEVYDPSGVDIGYLMTPDFEPTREQRYRQIMNDANLIRYEAALQNIVNVLGPELGIGCEDCANGCPGLLAEANEALHLARTALEGRYRLPSEEGT